MKKILTVISIVLIVAFAFTSCEEGLPEGVVKVMGKMGTNLLGADTSKVNGAVEAAKPNSSEQKASDGTIALPDGKSVKITESTLTISTGTGASETATLNTSALSAETKTKLNNVRAIMVPGENLSSVVEVLESNAKDALQEELKKPVSAEEKAAVEGTATVISVALDAAMENAGTNQEVKEMLQEIQSGLTKADGEEYTKADALVLQAMTNVVFNASGALSNSSSSNASQILEDSYSDLMTLKSICDNSGSSLTLDIGKMYSKLQSSSN